MEIAVLLVIVVSVGAEAEPPEMDPCRCRHEVFLGVYFLSIPSYQRL
jgi:hypothetical protein